jgi:hypothetical protein
MNPRIRILAIAVAAVVAFLIGWGVVSSVFFAPAESIDRLIRKYGEEVREYRRDVRTADVALAKLRLLAGRSYGADRDEVSARMHEHLEKLLTRTGLVKESIRSTGGGRHRGYEVVSRTVTARGPLERAMDFLYLLDQQPFLHRLDDVRIDRVDQSPNVTLSCRYSTVILLDHAGRPIKPSASPEPNQPTTAMAWGDLDTSERTLYSVVSRRNVLLPFVEKLPQRRAQRPRPRPRPQPKQQPRPQPKPRPQANPLDRYRLTDLSQWGDEQDVRVAGPGGSSKLYHPGDELAGGTVKMVDIRPLPMPGKPKIDSPSRVIIQTGKEYWAVELGQTLAQRRRLTGEELPPSLRNEPTTQPSDASARADTDEGPGADDG